MKDLLHRFTWVSFLAVIKRYNVKNLYLQVLMPLIGLIHFLFDRRVLKCSLLLFAMIVFNLFNFITKDVPISMVARLAQLTCIVCFMNFIYFHLNRRRLIFILKAVSILSAVYFVSELIFVKPRFVFEFLDFKIPRYNFIVGEVNFSGALFFGLFIISNYLKERFLQIIFLSLSIATFSRGVFLALLFFGLCLFVRMYIPKLLYPLLVTSLISVILYPLLIVGANYLFDEETNRKITQKSGRYYLHAIYSIEGSQSLIGNGYFESKKKVHDYLKSYDKIFPWMHERLDDNEQHSIQVQVLSDFGILGYVFFSLFLILVALNIARKDVDLFICLNSLLVIFSFLNGLSEWIFWFFLGLSLQGTEVKYLEWTSLSTWRKGLLLEKAIDNS